MKQHQKKYYNSLIGIILLIIATAMVLVEFGSSDFEKGDFGSNDLVGMAADGSDKPITIFWNDEPITLSKKGKYFVGSTLSNQQIVYDPTKQLYWGDKDKDIILDDTETTYKTTIDNNGKVNPALIYIFDMNSVVTASEKTLSTAVYTPSDNNFIITTNGGYSYTYKMVTIGGTAYAKYVDTRIGENSAVYYYNSLGQRYVYDALADNNLKLDKNVEGNIERSDILVDENGNIITVFDILITNENEIAKFQKEAAVAQEPAETEEVAKTIDYNAVASSLGLSSSAAAAVEKEDIAINAYLNNNNLKKWNYDVSTGNYYCKTCETPINYISSGDLEGTMVISAILSDVNCNNVGLRCYLYQQKNGFNPATYYYCTDLTCADPKQYTGDQLADIKSNYKDAQKEVEKTENIIQRAMDTGALKDVMGNPIKTTLRQRIYMNSLFQQQENQVIGLLAGYLNNFIDKELGSFSRGVPAGLCKYVFGLEYYKNAGWVSVPFNSSSSQLQSQLIANSRTVIIEGEKEEITEDMYRYAYTIRLLANQSLEWQTYLYNSCSAKTSVEQFYDYGALAPGAYFAFHYAGAAEQDMIFDCTIEDCLYDQACVAFADGSAPTCVSLVHGAGFETPDAGSDYDCAMTG